MPVRRGLLPGLLGAALLGLPCLAWAALPGQEGSAATGLTDSLAPFVALGPVGISPFLALGLFGFAADVLGRPFPPGLEDLLHPAVWGGLIALAVLLWLGRSSKLTKPLAETLGTGESIVAVLAVWQLVGASTLGSVVSDISQAGVLDATLIGFVAVSGLITIVIMRMSLDVLIWLSPVPFVDAAFQLAKTAITLVLVALAVLSPTAAIVVNVLFLIAAALALRWTTRAARFGLTLTWDASLDRIVPKREAQAPDETAGLSAFLLSGPSIPKRTRGTVRFNDGRWEFQAGRHFTPGPWVAVGPPASLVMERGWVSTSLTGHAVQVVLPHRYHDQVEAIARRTGVPFETVGGVGGTPIPAQTEIRVV